MRTSNKFIFISFLTVICIAMSTSLFASNNKKLISDSRMSAAQEVQEITVESDGRARAVIRFARDLSTARIRVRFSNLLGEFLALHLHCNVAGANGPIIVDLTGSDNITVSGNRVFGVITNEDFPEADPCLSVIGRPINNIASLAAAIDGGFIYWNLHTSAFPDGELRGQAPELSEPKD